MSNGPKQRWSHVNFVPIIGNLYKIKLRGICNNFNQFALLSSVSGLSNDVIKMAAIAQLLCVCIQEKSKYVGKINVFVNRFNASTAPDFKQKQYLHRIRV